MLLFEPKTLIMIKMTALLSLVAMIATTAIATAREENDHVVTWTKPGVKFRPRTITLQPQTVTITETQTALPTATLTLRSLPPPVKRSVKRAFLNGWSPQGCIADDKNLPPMVSPFPYQLSSEEVTPAACMDFCDGRGDSFAATQNGNECWCGEQSEASDITFIDGSKCDIPCSGGSGEMCGGKNSLGIFARADE